MISKKQKLETLLKPIVTPDEAKEVIRQSQTVPKPLYKTVFRQAAMYNEAYMMQKSSMDKSKVLNLVSPMLMNLCFSVELLMKAFILLEHVDIYSYSELSTRGININGHKYSTLFKRIQKDYRRSILEELSNELGIPIIDEDIFEQILISQNCNNSFIEWRYIFEETGIKSLNTELLMTFNDVMGIQLQKLAED